MAILWQQESNNAKTGKLSKPNPKARTAFNFIFFAGVTKHRDQNYAKSIDLILGVAFP